MSRTRFLRRSAFARPNICRFSIKTKMLKRQTYGKAGLSLLRKRMLLA